ncbi:hypothetical protein B0H19DRAFT_1255204 [Mycena capillaripes]|nr:hypothetical protein B0H19DRAFT_1255204 [Mycena capillaripes]
MSDYSNIRRILVAPLPLYVKKTLIARNISFRSVQAIHDRSVPSPIVITILIPPNWLQQAKSDIAAQFPTGDDAFEYPGCYAVRDVGNQSIRPRGYGRPALSYRVRDSAPRRRHQVPDHGNNIPGDPAYRIDHHGCVRTAATPSNALHKRHQNPHLRAHLWKLRRPYSHVVPRIDGRRRGDIFAKIDAEVLRVGKTVDEVGDEFVRYTHGTILNISGIPTMYDYEDFPQIPLAGPVAAMQRAAHEMLVGLDGLFLGTTPACDGESFVAFEAWARKNLHKQVYAVGPLLPPGYGAVQATPLTAPRNIGIKSFFDSMGSKYGDKSVLFISFGTVFWPKIEGQMEELLRALVEKEFPFFICHASPFATISAALAQKIKASDIGMTSTWGSQQFILTHPATGWFLSHCGYGGITEALASAVPMICWPFEGDQPISAMHLSLNLKVAFQLMEVRTGKGLQPLYNGYVPQGTPATMRVEFREMIDQCRGELGKERRKNAEQMRGEPASSWAAGGSSVLAINKFLADNLVPP